MELQGDRTIPAPLESTWAALNDPEVLRACIAGCESLDRTGENAFAALVAVKVGPVAARFKGNLRLADIDPPRGYTLHFDGQGGVAGFGKGSAQVSLEPDGSQTRLHYHARANVGGKLAQLGSRLIDSTAAKLTDDFFKAFQARVAAANVQPEVVSSANLAGAGEVSSPAPSHLNTTWWWWAGAALLAVALAFLLAR